MQSSLVDLTENKGVFLAIVDKLMDYNTFMALVRALTCHRGHILASKLFYRDGKKDVYPIGWWLLLSYIFGPCIIHSSVFVLT